MHFSWIGKCYWSCSSTSSEIISKPDSKIICISSSEDEQIKNKLLENGYKLIEASGAGYKILMVINGIADAYLLTKNSTFMWDTCGPQAILNALGGDILIYEEMIKNEEKPIKYQTRTGTSKVDACCNVGGILAYRNKNTLSKLINIFVN